MTALYADAGNLGVTYTGQAVTFFVDGMPALIIDVTSVDLVDLIRAAVLTPDDDDPAPRPCAECGARIEPDDGGALWYHEGNRSMMCDGDDSTDLTRYADPSGESDDDGPAIGDRETCAVGDCDQDIEWTGRAWTDRGGNSSGGNGHEHLPASECECIGALTETWAPGTGQHGHACPLYWGAL